MANGRAEEIADLMAAARANTFEIFDIVTREEDLRESPGGGFRPIIWHLAHIGVFEAYWILQKTKGDATLDQRYDRVFDPIKTPREESKNLPARREMEDYLTRVRDGVRRYLDRINFEDSPSPLLRDAYVFQLVLEHERQHQETLLYLLHLLDPAKKRRPTGQPVVSPATDSPPNDMVTIPAGPFDMGSPWNSFAYDNELPPRSVLVPAFKLDRRLTTNDEYANFIEEGGYVRREWWSEEGWAWREREGWEMPLYWTRDGHNWRARTMFGEDLIAPQHPVTGISWYEAEAYARFMGKRLPSEAEWEKAASWDAARERKRRFAWSDTEPPSPARCNFNTHFWGPTAVGSFPASASYNGCLDMTGNVWEWTNDPFAGFPGFEAYPYPEYSEVWFDGDHRVLKGGSWATRASVLRTSFRNFFRRHFRIAFAGIRCASEA